jgi:hypothetical protein
VAIGHCAIVNVVMRYAPDLQHQVQALLQLSGHAGPETPQPQDLRDPGAATFATVSGGHNVNKDTINDSPIALHRK